MSFILDTQQVDKGDRAEFVHEALGATMVPIELHWIHEAAEARAHGIITDLGDLTVCCGNTTVFRVERTAALARDDMEPSIFVNVQISGTSMVVQDGREVVLEPGALAIYDSTAPYTLLNDTGMTGEFFRIPHTALAMPHNMIRQSCAVSLSPGDPLTTLTYDYLRRVAADPALFSAPNADLIAHPSIELVRAVIATHHRADHLAADPLATTLTLRILAYAGAHHSDPDLSADQIAATHFISRRQLYKVLAEAGVSLNDWIRTHRLEACRRDLTTHAHSIAAIAARHGFTNMSSFSRAFRDAFGQSPTEWRHRHATRALRVRTGTSTATVPSIEPAGKPVPLQPPRETDQPASPHTPSGSEPASTVHPLQPTIGWMRQHAADPLDLQDIAKHAAVSRRTLNRQFRHHLNTTPLALLAQLRVDHAKTLLEATNLPVDRIAEQCGFGSYASMRYHFTRIVGVAPHHYRHGGTPPWTDQPPAPQS
ncbi:MULTISPECIES: helix-turn-helix domain-containing protein [unclassified Mycolicibacterium]|uniref:helix-turn-helix domain-containing protein n=1 Tax=unclassified Mycolicibacterium TaxID=2636767 RepID=UPI002EDA5E7A